MIDERFILFGMDATTQKDAIEALVSKAQAEGRVRDAGEVVKAVLEREKEGTTGFGKGIAIPHGKSKGVVEPTLMYGQVNHDLEWKAMDDAPVNKLFLILVPETSHEEHLQMLAKLARSLMHDEFVDALVTINDAKEMAEFLKAQLQ